MQSSLKVENIPTHHCRELNVSGANLARKDPCHSVSKILCPLQYIIKYR